MSEKTPAEVNRVTAPPLFILSAVAIVFAVGIVTGMSMLTTDGGKQFQAQLSSGAGEYDDFTDLSGDATTTDFGDTAQAVTTADGGGDDLIEDILNNNAEGSDDNLTGDIFNNSGSGGVDDGLLDSVIDDVLGEDAAAATGATHAAASTTDDIDRAALTALGEQVTANTAQIIELKQIIAAQRSELDAIKHRNEVMLRAILFIKNAFLYGLETGVTEG